jgi:4'-phosphopantetheinyl transferase
MTSIPPQPSVGLSRQTPLPFLEAIESPERDVQIYIAHLDAILPTEFTATLDAAEHARAAQFRFARDRRRYIATRGILRHLIGAAGNVPASAVAFEYGPSGKPELAAWPTDGRRLRFNLSHSAGCAIFALAWDRAIGVDLESSESFAPERLNDLALRVLSPREVAVWRSLPNESARSESFLRAWTRKEAYLKSTGEGLLDQLRAIEVALDAAAPQPSLTIRGVSKRAWTIHDLAAPTQSFAALAIEVRERSAALQF